MINLENDSGHEVQMLLVKYDYEPQYTDERYFKYAQGQQKSIERYPGRKYFIFVSDIDYVYGFILEGGNSYSYKGKGKMWDCSNNKWSEFKMLEDRPGQIGFYALLEEASLYLEGESIYLRENQQIYVDRPAGRYVIGYDSDYQNIINKYAVESGVSYYIAKGQMIVECNTNIILKPYKQGDVHDPKPTKKKETTTTTTTTTTVTTLSQQGKVVIKNGTNEEIQVAISIDFGSNQSNSYYKLGGNAHDAWGRTQGNFYQCCVFYRNVVYNFIVQAGRSYVFQATTKLIDIDLNTPVSYDDLWDEDGVISIRAMGGEYNISVNGGNEGFFDVARNTTARFYRQNGNYILTVNYNGQQKKYQVTAGYAYILWGGNLICYRTSIYVQVYTETTTTVIQVNQTKSGKIKITNGISGQISVSVAKDEGSNQNSDFFPLAPGKSEEWGRYCDNEYQCYILDPDTFTYGFIIMGGGNYTYQGQGKLWDNDKGILAEEDDLNLSTPGYVIVKAFRCNVEVTLTGGNNSSYNINQNQYARFARQPGNYVLSFNDLKGVEKRYLVTTGRSYYIYNSGSCIDKDSNVVLPLYTENQGSVVTYDDENINKVIQISGGSSSWQQWSSSYSSKTQVSYSHTSHSSSSFQQSSNFQSNFNNLGGSIANFQQGGIDINALQGMTGGKMIITNFDKNASAFQQMSGMSSMQTSSFSKTESYSSQTFQSSSYEY